MSSIKCMACGLVNFATAASCKRCQQPLNELAPVAEQRNYQRQPAQDYNSPPPPPVFHKQQMHHANVPQSAPSGYGRQSSGRANRQAADNCIKCGGANTSYQQFKKYYIPTWINGFAIAPLLMLILISFFKVTHNINAPFCDSCWEKFKNGKAVGMATGTLSMILAAGSIFAFTIFDSIVAFMGTIILSVVVYIVGHMYKESTSPKFKKVDADVVMIDTPAMGEINFANR